jgi:hypothetical protein
LSRLRSGQFVLQSTERLYDKQWQFATRGQDRLFYSLMACSKYEILYTDVLDCDTCNLMELSQVLYSYDCCMYVAGGMSARSYTIQYIMTRRALLHFTSSGIQFNCFISAITLLVHQRRNVQLGVEVP